MAAEIRTSGAVVSSCACGVAVVNAHLPGPNALWTRPRKRYSVPLVRPVMKALRKSALTQAVDASVPEACALSPTALLAAVV